MYPHHTFPFIRVSKKSYKNIIFPYKVPVAIYVPHPFTPCIPFFSNTAFNVGTLSNFTFWYSSSSETMTSGFPDKKQTAMKEVTVSILVKDFLGMPSWTDIFPSCKFRLFWFGYLSCEVTWPSFKAWTRVLGHLL